MQYEEDNRRLLELAMQFRNAIDAAYEAGEFANKPRFAFSSFPARCCGDTCYLLGHFLLEHGIATYHICGEYTDENPNNYQSHAWLMTMYFREVIDITADQFKDNPLFLNFGEKVYVGEQHKLHCLFDVKQSGISMSCRLSELECVDEGRLPEIYSTIMKYI